MCAGTESPLVVGTGEVEDDAFAHLGCGYKVCLVCRVMGWFLKIASSYGCVYLDFGGMYDERRTKGCLIRWVSLTFSLVRYCFGIVLF